MKSETTPTKVICRLGKNEEVVKEPEPEKEKITVGPPALPGVVPAAGSEKKNLTDVIQDGKPVSEYVGE